MRILKEQTKMALATLSSREQLVLRMRFGLGQTDGEQTLQAVLTPDQIRFIEAVALRKLRQPRPHIGTRNVERP
jgi:RNA polymerase primary sigma factor